VKLLGIETATAVCGVALVNDGAVVVERRIEERHAHAERLFGFIDDVLEEGHVALRDVDCLAVSIGPGSFTGLRIGLSVVKGLHMATGVPVVAVPTLTALARVGVEEACAQGAAHLVTVLDARRDEVYWQLFALSLGTARPVNDVEDIRLETLHAKLPDGVVAIAGEARKIVVDALRRRGGDASRYMMLSDAASRCSAVEVARCGSLQLAAGSIADVAALEPQYIKEFFLRTPE